MKSLLMDPDHNFEWQSELPPQAKDLVADLGLNVLFEAMAAGDQFLLGVVQRGVLCSLTDPATLIYRQQAWTDCLEHQDVVRAVYGLAVETLDDKRKIWGLFSNYSPELNLHHAIEVTQLMIKKLKWLREIAVESGQMFRSPAFKRFFAMLLEELDDPYFELVNAHLERLKFRRGNLMSAKLGRGNGESTSSSAVRSRRSSAGPIWCRSSSRCLVQAPDAFRSTSIRATKRATTL
jgi:hypothetical protein